MLRNDWEVTDRRSCLGTLEWLRGEGHRKGFAAALLAQNQPEWLSTMHAANRRHLDAVSFLV